MSISDVFVKVGEPFAAGLFEEPVATYQTRFSRAFKRIIDAQEAPDYTGGLLYPACKPLFNALGCSCGYHYSHTFYCHANELNRKIAEYFDDALSKCESQRKKQLLEAERIAVAHAVEELDFLANHNPILPRFNVGGRGWTHGVMDYESALSEGLEGINKKIDTHEKEAPAFHAAEREVLDALVGFVGRCRQKLSEADAPAELQKAFERVPLKGARSFYEAILSYNIFWYFDGADSAGQIDRILTPYLAKSDNPEPLFREFWQHFDICNGWHVILDCKSPLAVSAIKAQHGIRRPNSGIFIDDDVSKEVLDAIFDNWADGTPCPSLYARKNYLASACNALGLSATDNNKLCFGGCTELMVQGCSHVGSIEAGLNVLEVLTMMPLEPFPSYNAFKERLFDTLERKIDEVCECAINYRRFIAKWRPNPLRTLFYRDCLENSRDFNDFGARYNASVINIAGLTNLVNSLVAMRYAYEGKLSVDVSTLMKQLEGNYPEQILQKELLSLPKYGNGKAEADDVAKELSHHLFNRIRSHSTSELAMLPAVILFTTYAGLGAYVPATADGRSAGEALADSFGAMQGTDTEGPTALLRSASTPNQSEAIGTAILNIRLAKSLLASHESRQKVKSLIMAYFMRGGLQLQATVANAELLRQALDQPVKFPDLIVRIGGYSEYFQRLGRSLQVEVVKRMDQIL